MKAHGFEMEGPLKIKILATLPAWASGDEGREVYAEDTGKRYYGDSDSWVEYKLPLDNSVTMEKIQHGSIMLPYVMSEDETEITTEAPGSYTWVDSNVDKLKVYIPADATTLTASVLSYSNALYCAVRFKVNTITSSEVTVHSASETWYTSMTLNVSSLSGWYDIFWQVNSGTTGKLVHICAFSFIWE